MTSTTRRAMVIAPLACAFAPLMTPLVHAASGMAAGLVAQIQRVVLGHIPQLQNPSF